MATNRVPDDDVPVALPSLEELPPLERDEFEIPFFDRPSSLAIGDEDAARPSLDERDAVEGLAVDDLIDAFDDDGGSADDDVFDESFDGGIDEAPDADALGDDDDGLGNDPSDLDESLLTNERPDDGADGVDADVVAVDEPAGMTDEGVDEGETDEPILLPPLPRIDP
jgi:hypothetical protein